MEHPGHTDEKAHTEDHILPLCSPGSGFDEVVGSTVGHITCPTATVTQMRLRVNPATHPSCCIPSNSAGLVAS